MTEEEAKREIEAAFRQFADDIAEALSPEASARRAAAVRADFADTMRRMFREAILDPAWRSWTVAQGKMAPGLAHETVPRVEGAGPVKVPAPGSTEREP